MTALTGADSIDFECQLFRQGQRTANRAFRYCSEWRGRLEVQPELRAAPVSR
jgi:hypothetical protein